MNMTRKEFIAASTAFAVSPMLSAAGRAVKTPTFGRVYTGPGVIGLDPEKFRRNKEAMNI